MPAPNVPRINLQDPRDAKALQILATAYSWQERPESPIGKAYRIESSSEPGTFYHVNLQECECPDYRFRGNRCAHMRAVRLYCRIIQAHATRIKVALERAFSEPANLF